jgi:putative ubiquitin-RnfH superfamily antitoxin RatB of RatAB toxin-antitoxin module
MANAENNESVEMIEVEVACAVEGTQEVIALRMPAGSTLSDAVSLSNILSLFPSLDMDEISYGIYGTLTPEHSVIKDGDRVEIYRPLLISPMEARRLRAKRKKKKEVQEG